MYFEPSLSGRPVFPAVDKASVTADRNNIIRMAEYRLETSPWKIQRYMVCRKHWMIC